MAEQATTAAETTPQDNKRNIIRTARPFLTPIGLYVVSRIVVWSAILSATYSSGRQKVFAIVLTWDATHFFRIVQSGYELNAYAGTPAHDQQTYAFFPLFPYPLRVFNELFSINSQRGAAYAFVIWTTLIGLAAICALWWTTKQIFGDKTAYTTTLLLCFFPGSYILSIPYSEGMLLLFATLALWALHKKYWFRAGVFIFFAGLTRFSAVALLAAAGILALVEIYKHRNWKALIAPAIGSLGIIAYFQYVHHLAGSYSAWFTTQKKGWGQTFDLFAVPRNMKLYLLHPSRAADSPNGFVPVVGALILLALLWFLWKARLPIEYNVFVIVSLLQITFSPELLPKPRFILSAFPLFIAAAMGIKEKHITNVVAVSAGLLGLLTLMTLGGNYIVP